MSFRQFGGLQFASKHNAVASYYNTSSNLIVTQNVGQPNSYINFLSDISGNISIYGDFDLSGNLHVQGNIDCSGNLHVTENIDCSGNIHVSGDVDISGNLHVTENIDCSGYVNISETITNTATQPAPNDSSTKVPTTAWVQLAIGQYLLPITRTSTTALAFYPPTEIHLKATGYIIGRGGLAGSISTPDSGTWTMGGAGGGAGGVSFVLNFTSILQFAYFSLNYLVSGQSALSWNSTTPDAGNTFGVASGGGKGVDANMGAGGGTGGSGTWSSGLVPLTSTFTITNGTSGGNGTSFDGQSVPYPASGTNAINTSYGFGQSNIGANGYNTSGPISFSAGAIGSPICFIIWSIPGFS
jgi:hypothetical protein